MGGRGRWGGSKKGDGTWEREEELLGWRFDEDPGGGKAGVLGCCESEMSGVETQQCLECCGWRRRGCSKISGTRRWEPLVFDETVPPWRGLELEDMEAVEALTAR